MTFYEIYNSVLLKIWGDSTPPSSAVTSLQGDTGMISLAYKRMMQDYNFWFMRAYTTWDTVVGSQTYVLPALFKEIVSLQFKKEDEDYFLDPLSPLDLTDPYKYEWIRNNSDGQEYPEFFEMYSDYVTIYLKPSEIRTLHMTYWTFFSSPLTTDWAEATTTENAATIHGGEYISWKVAAEYSLIMKEYDQAQAYEAKALEVLTQLKREDYRRRQALIQDIRYEEF